jgi:hypothetical protein
MEGGIKVFDANLSISDSTIGGNVSENDTGNGGGINVSSGSSLIIQTSTIADNAANVGGGIYLDSTPGPGGNAATLVNATSRLVAIWHG